MTEAEWLVNADPLHMLPVLQSTASSRKLRLFGCACVRQEWERLHDEQSRHTVEVMERFADGEAHAGHLPAWLAIEPTATEAGIWLAAWEVGGRSARRMQSDLLREVFGNPFRPLSLDPALRTPTVVALAQVAYDERLLPCGELDPDRLTVLADALEDAGASETVMEHLRSPAPHVRGCHVVDALLGKQ